MSYGIDFQLDEDGDLAKGMQKTDSEGNQYWRHKDGSIHTVNGEGAIEVRDVGMLLSKKTIEQIIRNRLMTNNPEWYHHTQIGANLSDLVGEPNTKQTAMKGVQMIQDALTYKGFLSIEDFSVRPLPISANQIMFVLTVELPNEESFRLPLVFDLQSGLKEVKVV